MRVKIVTALGFALLLASLPSPSFARGFPRVCAGTYLIEEDGGAKDFWTFAIDGTFFGTTSTQPLFNFSNQQGSWRPTRNGAQSVLFAFVWDDDDTLLTTARIEITIDTVGRRCSEISGSLEVRTFEDGEDPLDPSTDNEEPIATDTFSGRRVTISR